MGYPLQYSWATPVAQMVKNAPAGLVLPEEGNPAGLSSYSGALRPLVKLCVAEIHLLSLLHNFMPYSSSFLSLLLTGM